MEASERIATDICVIGGGPAGSTIAHRLASFGHKVCLVESHAFPRSHIGASLPPSILPLLESIGARDCVERAGFPRSERIVVWWSEAVPTIKNQPGTPGFHVDRGQFDQLLLEHAKNNGVRVLQPAHALPPERLSYGEWKIRLHHNGARKELTSKIVVDASGGRNLLPGRRIRRSEPLLALYAHWKCAKGPEIDACVEAGENEWFWCAPLGRERAIAAVFIDPKQLSETIRQGIEIIYRQLVRRFRLFPHDQLDGIVGEVKACDASCRYSENAVGPDFVRVGDANLSLDPLSSQGVLSAMASGLQAAVVVNTFVRRPGNTDIAIAFYLARQEENLRRHAAKTANFYEERSTVCDQPFWRRRAVAANDPKVTIFENKMPDDRYQIQLSNTVRINSAPIIKEDMIVSAPTLYHDSLDRPVAFVGGVEIVPLLNQIRTGQTIQAVIQTWSQRLPIEICHEIMHWLWRRKIVAPMYDIG